MSISCNVSKSTLKQMTKIHDDVKDDILYQIWEEYLVDYIDYNSFVKDFKPTKKNRQLSRTKKILIIEDDDRCQARVWRKLDKEYVRCNKSIDKNSDTFCCYHSEKQNYGKF